MDMLLTLAVLVGGIIWIFTVGYNLGVRHTETRWSEAVGRAEYERQEARSGK